MPCAMVCIDLVVLSKNILMKSAMPMIISLLNAYLSRQFQISLIISSLNVLFYYLYKLRDDVVGFSLSFVDT